MLLPVGSPPLTQPPYTTFPAPMSANQAFSFFCPYIDPCASRPGKVQGINSSLMESSAGTSLGDTTICRVGLKWRKPIHALI